MENPDTDGDDMFNTVCGDLGLGNVRRNSLLLKYNSESGVTDENLIPLYHVNDTEEQLSTSPSDVRFKIQDFIKKGIIGSVLSRSHIHKNNNISESSGLESARSEEVFPTYADVPYGTSYRQQKKLYEQQMGHLRQQQNAMILLDKSGSPRNMETKGKDKQVVLTPEELDQEIQHAMLEMDELKLELDACCKRLDAKYQAVAILKKQAEVANSDLQTSEKKFYENNKKLEKEVSKLQFELEWRESSFMDSQQTWAERFDRVCRDNSTLTTKLEDRNEEMRRMMAHKTAIARERDELLALLDVTERMKYEQGKSMIAEEEYGSFTSTELAVLGACKCRGANPEPCGCAHAAANLRKEIVKLREEIKEINKRRQEAYLTVDAYRLAFEEQMAKGRQMSQQLATLSTLTSRSVKAKAAMKFLLKSLSSDDDEMFSSKAQPNHCDESRKLPQDKPVLSLQELVQALTDVVHEKEEALVQQKLAAQVLANKLEELEKKQNLSPGASTDSGCCLHCKKERPQGPSRDNSVEDGGTETSREKDKIYVVKNNTEMGDDTKRSGDHKSDPVSYSHSVVSPEVEDVNICRSENKGNKSHEEMKDSSLGIEDNSRDTKVDCTDGLCVPDGFGEKNQDELYCTGDGYNPADGEKGGGGESGESHLVGTSWSPCEKSPENNVVPKLIRVDNLEEEEVKEEDVEREVEHAMRLPVIKVSRAVWSPIRQQSKGGDNNNMDGENGGGDCAVLEQEEGR